MSGSKMPVKKHIRRAFWHAGAELSCFPRAVNGSSKIDLIVQMNPNGFQWLSADRKISGPARLKPAPTVMLWCPSRHGRPCCDRNLRPCTEVVNFTSEVTHLDEVSVSWMGTWENTGLSRFRLNGKHGKHGKPWTRFELTMFFQFFFFSEIPFILKFLSIRVWHAPAQAILRTLWRFFMARFVMLRDASGWDANQRGDSKGWTSLWSVLISFDSIRIRGFGRSQVEKTQEKREVPVGQAMRGRKRWKRKAYVKFVKGLVKGVAGIGSRNRNASGWPEIATARTHNIWGHKIFGARDCWEVPGPESRRSHAGHQVKSADAWKWSIFSWHWCRKRFENISCSDLCLNACFVRGKSP